MADPRRAALMQRLAEAKSRSAQADRMSQPGLGMPDLEPVGDLDRLPPRELRSHEVGAAQPDTFREMLANMIAGGQQRGSGTMARPLAEALTGTGYGQFEGGSAVLPNAKGESSFSPVDIIPGVSDVLGAGESWEAAEKGDWTGAALSGLGIAIPGGKQALKGGLHAIEAGGDLFKGVRKIDPLARLPGAPSHVEGPVPHVAQAAEDYAGSSGLDLKRQSSYAEANPRRGRYIAEAYEKMPHAPDDPKVAASYDALAKETMAQWHALQDAGAKIEFLKPGQADPYPGGPREALADLRANNHLYVFPSDQGFGSGEAITNNPLLAPTGINHGGHDMVVNDAFRAVHDYFGHGMEGANFGARGEENAWQAHKRLFSPEAMPALTSETRGQNSWVNFGPHGEANRANPRETVFADQKTGIMPSWTTREGGMPLKYRAQQAGTAAALASALALMGDKEQR